ncbi:MAG: hypothetical protein HYY83_09100 [Deltaproteobacteria bacterium]|nr:hypothetical protein [Deltaproteobacteria bacterium]
MASRFRQLSSHGRLPGLLFLLAALLSLTTGFASSHFTERQLAALERYAGKSYWVVAWEGKLPSFSSAPSPAADFFLPQAKESFQITEIVQGSGPKAYYYKVRFDTGREGYIEVDFFLGQLNLTLLTVDPDRGQRIRAAREVEEESKREARIRAQPWPEHIKEAVLKRQAVLGMNMKEAREALGRPRSAVKLKNSNPLMGEQEQWIYQGGLALTFTNGTITRIQSPQGKGE